MFKNHDRCHFSACISPRRCFRLLLTLTLLVSSWCGASAQCCVGPPRSIDLKTNAVAWGLLVGNVAGEFHFDDRWSLNIPVYYGACNYFTSKIKFRALGVMPEVRLNWPVGGDDTRMFAGAHMGLSYYDMALNGRYRIQDHDAKNPTVGFGLSVGLRHPISKDKRWFMEYSLGAGYYHLYYDKWDNKRNGILMGTERHWKTLVDNVAVTIGYTFKDL